MKLVTYDAGGGPRPGAVVGDDRIVDLIGVLDRFAADTAVESALRAGTVRGLLARDDVVLGVRSLVECATERGDDAVLLRRADLRLLPPIVDPAKVVGVGLNYRDHAEEQKARIPKVPILFAKFASSLIGADDDIRYPSITDQLDFEAELAVVIGRPGRDIPVDDAMSHIAGYCILNDVTARDVQLSDRQWLRGKTPDAITPVGPWLTTADEIADPGKLGVKLWLNGELMQDSTTEQLIFDVPNLVSFISRDLRLEAGDIIATGTPGGVGFVRDPAVFMKPGDRVAVEVDGLGRLENTVATA